MTEQTPPGDVPPHGPPPGAPQGPPPGAPHDPPISSAPVSGGYPPPGGYSPPPGGYPPPPGGYAPPPSAGGFAGPPPNVGGYPPPPPAAGSYPPPPPAAGGYAPPPAAGGYPPPPSGYGAAPQLSIGDAFNWAWNKFTKNAGPLIVGALVILACGAVVYGVFELMAAAVGPDYDRYGRPTGGSEALSVAISFFGRLVWLVVGSVLASGFAGGVLDIANGVPVTFASFLRPRRAGEFILVMLMVFVGIAVGVLACFVGAVVVAVCLLFAPYALLDREISPIDAVKMSFETVKSNVASAILVYLVGTAIMLVGILACGVGFLVAMPVAMLFLVYSWRRMSGGPIAPLTP